MMYERHGGKKFPEYNAWVQMRQRCNNPKDKAYKNYGGRGIEVCDRWNTSFADFIKDMGRRPIGHSLDRIDNDGNYEPSNCRWSTWGQQMSNKRSHAKSSVKHVYYMNGRWRILVNRGGARKYYGHYDNLDEARIGVADLYKSGVL